MKTLVDCYGVGWGWGWWWGVWRVRQTWQETLNRLWIQCAVACQPRPQAAPSGLTGRLPYDFSTFHQQRFQAHRNQWQRPQTHQRMKKAFMFDLSMTIGQRSNIFNSKQHSLLQLFNVILQLPCILLGYRFTATTLATMEKNAKYNKVRYLYWS